MKSIRLQELEAELQSLGEDFEVTQRDAKANASNLEKALQSEKQISDTTLQGMKQLALDKKELDIKFEAAILENKASAQQLQELEVAMAAEKQRLEGMRRAALLQKVYNEFDLDGGGDVGEEELLELGRARRRLGQKSGEWTPRANRALVRKMGCNEQGIL